MKEKSAAALSQTADFFSEKKNALMIFLLTKFDRCGIIESVRQHPGAFG